MIVFEGKGLIMDISVVVLTYNEENNIKACLDSLLTQEFKMGQWEVMVVDGGSQDNTVKIVQGMQKVSDPIRLISNEKKLIAAGRNLGLRESRYAFVAFTDADCVVPKNWLEKLAQEFKRLSLIDNKIAGVGGANVPFDDKSKFSQALGIYLDSFLGSFNSVQGRNFNQVKNVESLACLNVLYKKDLLIDLGMFDEKLKNIGEDADLNLRLKEKGCSLYFIPNLSVLHKLRPNLSAWLCNMFIYGKGRAIVSVKHNNYLNLFFVLPLFFAVGMLLLPFGPIFPVLYLSFLYFPIIFLYTILLALKRDQMSLFPMMLAIFISTHFVYSFALLTTFIRVQFNKRIFRS